MSTDRALSVCALVPYSLGTTPSQRYRLEQWLPQLHAEGISVDLLPFTDARLMRVLHRPGAQGAKALALLRALARRSFDIARLRRYDAVIIHRAASIIGPAWLERMAAQLGCPIIFDFDDAIYLLHTTAANRRFGWLKFPGKTSSICRLSTQVVVGNTVLADYARQFNSNVSIIPSSVDTTRFQPRHRAPNSKIVLGWTGSSTSQTYLEMFAPTLKEIMAQCDVELRVHSDRAPNLPGIPLVWRPWDPDTEAEELSHFDIGIMPLPNDDWARGKCAMKALLYMAMGIPTICSAVGVNCELIQHGENGLLATEPQEWVAQVQSLCADAALRSRLGEAGRKTIEKHYSMNACGAHFARVVREAADSKGAHSKKDISLAANEKQ